MNIRGGRCFVFETDWRGHNEIKRFPIMAILPPDPLFCMKSDMGYVHSLCFKDNTTLLAATESGFVYFWDLEVIGS